MPPFKKGQSGNPGGRRALPPEVREALRAAGPAATMRLIALAEDEGDKLKSDPKTLPVYFAANVRVFEIAYGKNPEPPGLEEPAIDGESAMVPRVQPSDQHIAGVMGVLRRMGKLPLAIGAGDVGPSADAAPDAVHPASPAPDTGGVPPP